MYSIYFARGFVYIGTLPPKCHIFLNFALWGRCKKLKTLQKNRWGAVAWGEEKFCPGIRELSLWAQVPNYEASGYLLGGSGGLSM